MSSLQRTLAAPMTEALEPAAPVQDVQRAQVQPLDAQHEDDLTRVENHGP